MSLAIVESRREKAKAAPSRDAYKTLVEEEAAFVAAQAARVEAAVVKERNAQAQRDRLQAAVNDLRGKLERTRSQMPPSTTAVRTAEDLAAHRRDYEALMKEFATRKQTLTHLLSYQPADFKQADLSVVSHWLDTWGGFLTEAEASCKALKRRERNTPNAEGFLPPVADLYAVLDDVCRLQLQARSLVGRERYRRSAYHADSVADFVDNQQQLLRWCRKQHETLRGLAALEDLREFGRSFHANVPVMDSNFLVLSEQCDVLAGNPRVQDAMKEVNTAWVDLCLGIYEKLKAVSREAHEASGLEEDCQDWARRVIPQVAQLLAKVDAHFSGKRDPAAAEVRRVLQRCEETMKEQDAFRIVSIHLADFSVREECVKPHLDALRKELRSDTTSTVLSFPCVVEYEGRLEYANRIEELREWIDVKSQKSTYMKLLERLESTKVMIQEYADALFPEEDADTAA